MGKYFFYRFLLLLPKLLLITVLIFIGIQLMPGDPITYRIPADELMQMDEAQIEAARERMGLNDPVPVQYLRWIGGVLRGDFGYSHVSGASIRSMLLARLPATMEIALGALILSTFFGITLGFFSAVYQNSPLDYAGTVAGMVGISVPAFFFGLLGIWFFALTLRWLPTGGRFSPGHEMFLERLDHLVMPCIVLAISLVATLMRYTRSSMLDVLGKDYIKTAKSKGVPNGAVYLRHGLRNALTPVIIVLVGRLSLLVSGTVVIESVFNYPGVGSMLLTAINAADIPLIMITSMLIAAVLLLCSLLSDLCIAALDPRVRFGKESA